MGVGPAFAIPAAVKSAGLELGNIDLFEINEVKVLAVVMITSNTFFVYMDKWNLNKYCTKRLAIHWSCVGICVAVCLFLQEIGT